MPAVNKKPLYLAKGMKDLNKMADVIPKISAGQAKMFAKSADKVFKSAVECASNGDEEKAYVFYMKYFNIISAIKQTADYKKNESFYKEYIGMKNCRKAIDIAETLCAELKNRYDEREAEEVSKRLETINKIDATKNEYDDDVDSHDKSKDVTDVVDKQKVEKNLPLEPVSEKASQESLIENGGSPAGSISVQNTYTLLKDDKQVLLMDVRTSDDFEESHINHRCCISVPCDIIPPGTTVKAVEQHLPAASIPGWRQRADKEVIILFDWQSGIASVTVGSVMQSLRDALFKWDSQVTLKTTPLVMEGGYEEWLNFYPMMTTNAHVSGPPNYSDISQSSMTPLHNIDYDLDLAFLMTPDGDKKKNDSKKANEKLEVAPKDNKTAPAVDRKQKPKATSLENVKDKSEMPAKPVQSTTGVIRLNNDLKTNVKSGDEDNAKDEAVVSLAKVHPPAVKRSLKPKQSNIDEAERRRQKEESNGAMEQTTEMKRTKDETGAQREDGDQAEKHRQGEVSDRIDQHLKEDSDRLEERQRRENVDKTKKTIVKKHADNDADSIVAAESEERRLAVKENMKRREEEEEEMKRRQEAERIEEMKKAERKLKEDQERKTQEERAKREEMQKAEKKLAEAKKKAEEEKERERQRRAESERLIREKQEHERKRQEAELKERLAAEAARTATSSTRKSTGVEKRFDQASGKYFYIDHESQRTSWQPPTTVTSKPDETAMQSPSRYVTALRDEDDAPPSGALKRSHSSPNIAKMLQDKGEGSMSRLPKVDRSIKPSVKQELRSMPVHTDRANAKVRNLQAQWGNVIRGQTGLRNLGNTCYMNSIIQSLSNTAPFCSYFLNNNYRADINRENKLGTGGEVAEEFAVLIKALWCGQYRSITPNDFKKKVGKHHPMFAGYEQQDSQELLTFLMSSLHEDLNLILKRVSLPEVDNDGIPDNIAAQRAWELHKTQNKSIIVELFQGQLKSTLRCLRCDKTSVKFDTFMFLTLALPTKGRCTLQECLQHYSKEEKMLNESGWNCPRCRCKRDAVKTIEIWKLPPILLIHLNRFYHQGMWRDKNSSYVDFPLDGLDLVRYVSGPKPRFSYSLYAVSNHYGTMEGGHYTAYCKNADSQRWYKYDDQEVNEIFTGDIKSSAAYIFFYTNIKTELMFS